MGKQRPNINPPASLPPQHHHEVRRIQESLFSFFTPLRYPNLQFAKMSSPFSINGGACVAMVGKDCVAIRRVGSRLFVGLTVLGALISRRTLLLAGRRVTSCLVPVKVFGSRIWDQKISSRPSRKLS